MAQRVYLIPIRPELISAFVALVKAPPAHEEEIWKKLEQYSMRQRKLAELSRYYARGLTEAKFEAIGRDIDYYEYTASRPYLVTGATAEAAVSAVRQLRQARNAAEANTVFEAQVRALADLWSAPAADDAAEGSPETHWLGLRETVRQLKEMKSCFHARRPFTTQMLKQELMDGTDLPVMNLDESVTTEIATGEIPRHYGDLLGNTFGRVAGLSEPTWWLGRNYWLGLLAFSNLGMLQKMKYGKVQKAIADHATSPATLFGDIALPKFESGFDLRCPAYSTGLYFGPHKVASLLAALQQSRKDWEELTALVTGYPGELTAGMVRMIEEALMLAASENHGLLEGDELVGSYGLR